MDIELTSDDRTGKGGGENEGEGRGAGERVPSVKVLDDDDDEGLRLVIQASTLGGRDMAPKGRERMILVLGIRQDNTVIHDLPILPSMKVVDKNIFH